jgi:FkbM family methyltransferase
MPEVNNFTVIESIYGRFVVNRRDKFQAEALIRTGRPHIQGELDVLLAIADTLPNGAFVVDAGANIGLVAIPLAQRLKPRGGTVLAFEVQRMIYYALCAGAVLNDLDNLFTFHQGLGARARVEPIASADYGAPQDFGMYSLLNQPAERNEAVQITTLDEMGLPRLDFLKIDVEGMEMEVLAGAKGMIARHKPWCWVEYWMVGAETIAGAFAGLGYECYVVDELNLLCAPSDRLAASGLAFEGAKVPS